MIVIKTCSKHGDLSEDLVCRRKNRPTIECKLCKKEQNKKTYEKYKITRLAQAAEYRKENRQKLREWAKNDRKVNKDKYSEYERLRRQEIYSRKNLSDIKYRFGLEPNDYLDMVYKQENKCAICKQHETRLSRKYKIPCKLCIDHCHTTGKVRGLLCHACNTGIGKFKDNIQLLESAIKYLKHD